MSDQHTQLVFNKPFRAGFISALVVIIFIALSCKTELPQLADIDIEEWSSDRNACQGYRQSVVKALDAQRSKLLALSANEITAILGKPDQIELYKRNQKLFFYNLCAFVFASCVAKEGGLPRFLAVKVKKGALLVAVDDEKLEASALVFVSLQSSSDFNSNSVNEFTSANPSQS